MYSKWIVYMLRGELDSICRRCGYHGRYDCGLEGYVEGQ
jgi:hypothetical protein